MAITKVTSGLISADASSIDLNIDAGTLYLDVSENKVGIGNTSPTEKLHVQGTALMSSSKLSTNNGTTYWDLRRDSSTGHFVISDDGLGDVVTIKQDTGNVGIGTDSPTTFGGYKTLHFKNTGGDAIQLTETDGGVINQILCTDSSGGKVLLGSRSNHPTIFCQNDTERMRIDSSGNLLVGTTSTSVGGATSGYGFRVDGANGIVQAAASGNTSAIFNRTSSDGAIVSLRKNGSEVGNIGTYSSDRLFIGAGDTNITFKPSDDIFYPSTATGAARDNAIGLGDSGARFKDLYLSGTANVGSYSVNSSTGIELKGSSGQINHDVFTDNSATTTIMINSRVASGANACLQYRTNNVIEGNILGSSTGLAISNVSDYRKKQNIRNLTGSLDIIKSLQPRVYNYKEGFAKDTTKDYVGFIAHELSEYIPDSVIGTKDEVYTQNDIDNGVTDAVIGEPKYQSVLYSSNEILTRLVQSIQEQQTIIDDLKTRIETLENA